MYKISTECIGDVKKYVWHYRKANKEYGPFTYEDIIEMVKKGEIGPDEYVLKFGNKKFIKVSEVQGLFDIIVQRKEEKKEQIIIPEEQVAVSKEEKEEFQVTFEDITAHIPAKHKQGASTGQKVAMIMIGAVGLGLAAWLLIQMI